MHLLKSMISFLDTYISCRQETLAARSTAEMSSYSDIFRRCNKRKVFLDNPLLPLEKAAKFCCDSIALLLLPLISLSTDHSSTNSTSYTNHLGGSMFWPMWIGGERRFTLFYFEYDYLYDIHY